MPVEELDKVVDDVGHKEPTMVHLCWMDNPDVGLCGTTLTGKFHGPMDGTPPLVDCVVCADIFKASLR